MSGKKKNKDVSPVTLAFYEKLVKNNPAVTMKGDTIPYTSLNGHMFSFIGKDGVVGIRLPDEVREEFLKKYKTTLVTAYGTVLKEYVSVPEKLLSKTNELKKYFDLSVDYVKSLKPKPSKGAAKKKK